MWQLPLMASSGQQRLYTLQVQLRTSKTKYGEKTGGSKGQCWRKTRQPSHSPDPRVPRTPGHTNDPPITATHRKWFLNKYLRIISHLLFRPFKSIFSIPGKHCKETNCLQATPSEARLEPHCSPEQPQERFGEAVFTELLSRHALGSQSFPPSQR